MTLFVGAARGTYPVFGPPVSRVAALECQDHFLALSFGTRNLPDPMRRAALLGSSLSTAFSALWHNYSNDSRQLSVCARVLGFCFLMERSRGEILQLWEGTETDKELVALHPAVVETLAGVPLADNGMLGESPFLAYLAEVAKRYPDLQLRLDLAKATTQPPDSIAWPPYEGESAALIRSRDWTGTPCGDISTWPQSKKTAIDLTLACKFPMIVLWGPELIQFYNDSYRDLMGSKHPAGLGQPTRECWPEVWSINEPFYTRVLAGESITFEDQLFPIVRYGFLEDAYFTLCYSPLREESNAIAGVLVTVFETTLRARAKLHNSREQHAHGTNGDIAKRSA